MPPELISILLSEKSALRDELKHLKLCQLNYFTISVTTTGALLGLGSKIGSGETPALLYFAPLLIILPCWWIFFDKATTIARIVGYTTILDRILSYPPGEERYRYIGWEAALYYYRSTQVRPSAKDRLKRIGLGLWFGFSRVLTFQTSHRYWSINYCTYSFLAFICWILGSVVLSGGTTVAELLTKRSWFPLVVIIISCGYNLYVAGDLIKGGRSYNAHVKAWDTALRTENAKKVLSFSIESVTVKSPNTGPQADA